MKRVYNRLVRTPQQAQSSKRSVAPVTVSKILNTNPTIKAAQKTNTNNNANSINTSALSDSILSAMGLTGPSNTYDTAANNQEQNPVQLVGQGSMQPSDNTIPTDTIRFAVVGAGLLALLWLLGRQ